MDPSVDHRARRKRVACLYDDECQGCLCSWSNDLILRFGVTIQLKWSECAPSTDQQSTKGAKRSFLLYDEDDE